MLISKMVIEKFKFIVIPICLLISSGCKTIAVPLVGVPIGKPHAIGGDYGVRITSGIALLPNIQGVVDEVKDPNGETINPIPGDPIFDSSGNQIFDYSGKPLEESLVSLYPVMDLALGFADKYEIGFNTARGTYAIVDLYKDRHWSVSVSPAYGVSNPEINESDLSISEAEGYEYSSNNIVAMEGRVDNFNTTLFTSGRLVSDNSWFELAPYIGVGVNAFKVKIKDHRSLETKSKESTALSALGGLHLRLWIFELTSEAHTTTIKNRNGKSSNVTSIYSSGGISLFF
ncbi:MAG: hypothetical protein KBD78_07740 [Oligoflexales bacterium]|nr:hypothetical protein [Oligoflexales bacterium]